MKIVATLAGVALLSVASAMAEAPAAAPESAPAAAPAAAAPAAQVDQSKLTPNMQAFMGRVDSIRNRRTGREGEATSRVLPEGPPIASREWHKAQGHKHVNWSGASGYGGGHRHHKKAEKADAGAPAATAEKAPEKAAETKEAKPEKKKKGGKKAK